jgi:hypothetical protein
MTAIDDERRKAEMKDGERERERMRQTHFCWWSSCQYVPVSLQ